MSGDILRFHVPGFNPISQQCTKIPDFLLVSVQGNKESNASIYIVLDYMTRFVSCRFFFPPAELRCCTGINCLAWMSYLGVQDDVIFEGKSVWLVHSRVLCSDRMYLPLLKEIQ